MKITSVEKHKKNKDMLSVHVDNAYAFTIAEEDFIGMNLYEMSEITKHQIDHIKDTINFRAAKSAAIKYLSLRVRSEKEVRLKLDMECFDNSVIDTVIEDLKSMGYINDKIYTTKYIYDRSKLKPISKKLLKFELQKKGISEEVINEVLADWEIDEATIAEGLVKRKFGKYDLHDEAVIKKVYSFLLHRGFGYELIEQLVNRLRA